MELASRPTRSPASRSAQSAELPSRTKVSLQVYSPLALALVLGPLVVFPLVHLLEAPRSPLELLYLLFLSDLDRRHLLAQRQVPQVLLDQDLQFLLTGALEEEQHLQLLPQLQL